MTARIAAGFSLLVLRLSAACMPVTGDRILGRDLALAEPALAALPASYAVGFAPAPGERRILASAELNRIARSNGINAPLLDEVCFEFPVRQLSRQEIAAAMRSSLPTDSRIEIVELGKTEAPVGDIDFALGGLEPGDPAGTRVWRGWVHYSPTRKLPIWARVRILEDYIAVVATRDLAPGVVLDAAWLRAERQTGPLPKEPLATKIGDVQGQVLKRAIKAGVPLPVSFVTAPLAVRRGETVRVNVASGWARLRFEAVAEADAREGEQIALRNPISGKTFRARVDGNGKATVVIGGPVL